MFGGESVQIREKREIAGLTQARLSLELGVRQNTISQWENGKRGVPTGMLPTLARILGCTVDELLRPADAERPA
jgi:transcriptional regulator with XRE-family HTH domain